MNRFVRTMTMCCAWVCFALGFIGVVVPVLPTTPFMLLATFLFARSSERCHTWITSTKVYKKYVGSFKDAGGMPVGAKIRMLTISYAVLAVSAIVSQKPLVWAILTCVAVFLLWLVAVRIPTVSLDVVCREKEAKEV